MHAALRSLRALTAGLSLAAALPALAQDAGSPPPPPPEALPWVTPPRPPPPPAPRRVRPTRPVYRPDYAYGERPPGYPPPEFGPDGRPGPGLRRPWYPQVEVAFRSGIASPGGTAVPGLAMSDLFGEQLALGVELGVRTTPNLYVGLLAEGAFGGAGPAASGAGCTAGVSCDSGAVGGRLGVQLRYHFAPYAPIDPWVGYGVAIAGATVSGDDAYGSYSRTLSGVEYAKLSVGADLRLSRGAAIGLYAEWTSGTFTQLEDREGGVVVASGSVASPTTYSWFTAGPRIRF